MGPEDLRPAAGTSARILDETDPGAELHAFTVALSGEAALHHHPGFQMAYVVTGTGTVADADGHETEIGPGGVVSCPAGPSGAHAFRSTGTLPLQLLHVSPSPDGSPPEIIPGA